MIFLELFITFFKIGLFGFGGGYGMLSLIQHETVERAHWMTTAEFTDIVAISQMTPGPIGINSATYCGYTAIHNAGYSHLMAVLGSATATFALVLPSLILMILISKLFMKYMNTRPVRSVFAGLRPAVIGLLAAATLLLCNAENFSTPAENPWQFWISVALFAATAFGTGYLRINPIRMICYAAFAGLLLLYSCTSPADENDDMRRQLQQLAADNRADSLLTNDSLALTLTDYFDRHGNENERMMAHYLLARTYYDRGELPAALEAYHEAADCADTTRADCDFATLSRVHAQMATLFHQHYQPRTALSELSKAQRLAYRGRDTLMAIECYFEQSNEYERIGDTHTALAIATEAARLFADKGQYDRAAAAKNATTLMLLEQHRTAEAKSAIEAYLASAYTDSQGNVSPGREIFYYKRGLYYLQAGQTDSAEFFFRKELREGRDMNNQIAGRKGLQQLYQQLGKADSVAKYAAEGYNLSDSIYILSESQNIQSLQAMFNYTQNQLMVIQKTSELKTTKIRMAVVVISLLVVIGILVYVAQRRERQRAIETAQYRSALEQLSQAQADLMLLHEEANTASSQAIAQKNQQIKTLQEQVSQFQQLKKDYNRLSLEDRLANADVTVRLRSLANDNPPRSAEAADIKELKMLINDNIPAFFDTVSPDNKPLSELEYTVCLLTRLSFLSSQVDRLNGVSEGYTSTMKSRIFKKVTGQNGTAKDFERWIADIK